MLAAGLIIAYCIVSFSVCVYNDGSSASTERLATGDVLKAPKANLSS